MRAAHRASDRRATGNGSGASSARLVDAFLATPHSRSGAGRCGRGEGRRWSYENARPGNTAITIAVHARGMIGLRVVLVALGAALGIVLLSQGYVVIGGLILAMAVVRGVLVLKWRSRMTERQARRQAFRARLQARRGA